MEGGVYVKNTLFNKEGHLLIAIGIKLIQGKKQEGEI